MNVLYLCQHVALAGVILLVMASYLIVFLLAERIDRILGNTGRVVLSCILGLLLAALAIQIIGDGALAFMQH